MFEVILSNTARKGAKDMPEALKIKLIALLDVFERNPFPVEEYDIKKLRGLENTYRIRLGDWRVIYKVDFVAHRVIIVKVAPRKSAYKK